MDENIASTKESDMLVSETNKKELGRKFFVFLVWIILVVAIAVLVGMGKCSEDIFSQTMKSFYVISIVYIGGNVTQKLGKYAVEAVSDYVSSKTEGEK